MADSQQLSRARLSIGGAYVTCRIGDLSLAGVSLIGRRMPVGSTLELHVGAGDDEVELACVVRWNTSEGCRLEFEEPSASDVRALTRLLRHAARPHSDFRTETLARP